MIAKSYKYIKGLRLDLNLEDLCEQINAPYISDKKRQDPPP